MSSTWHLDFSRLPRATTYRSAPKYHTPHRAAQWQSWVRIRSRLATHSILNYSLANQPMFHCGRWGARFDWDRRSTPFACLRHTRAFFKYGVRLLHVIHQVSSARANDTLAIEATCMQATRMQAHPSDCTALHTRVQCSTLFISRSPRFQSPRIRISHEIARTLCTFHMTFGHLVIGRYRGTSTSLLNRDRNRTRLFRPKF